MVSLVFTASAEGRQVLVQATGPSSPEMVMVVLDYAMQSWPSVPSPQGFVFGCVRGPEIDPTTYETIGMGEFDGGAVLLRRGAEPSVMTASDWLKAALQSVGPA